MNVTIAGRTYTVHMDGRTTPLGMIYRITGTRSADGALMVYGTDCGYIRAGHVSVVGISALKRVDWWELADALDGVVPGVVSPLKAVNA